MEHDIGSLRVGSRADFVLMDEHVNIMATYINGTLRYLWENN